MEKYRLWCKNKNEWEKDEFHIMPSGCIFNTQTHSTYNLDTHILVHGSGLIIKDNKELFECDVYRKYKNVYVVGYSQIDGFHFRVIYDGYLDWNIYNKRRIGWLHMTDYDAIKCELIGNIFENPELLEYEGGSVND